MSLIEDIKHKYKAEGVVGVCRSVLPYIKYRSRKLMNHVIDYPQKFNMGQICDIYTEQWDLLIVLDACRYDLMESVSDDYYFVDNLELKHSPASSSREWLEYQFRSTHADEIKQTAYITGNTFSNEVLTGEYFALLDEVWKYEWDKETGIVPPRPITDRAISVARETTPNRMVVHYMQPHFPSVENPDLGGKVDPVENRWINSVWDQLAGGELSYKTVWEAYESNLHRVLSEVELLLNNVEFDTVAITADHGNGFGERGIYGHPSSRIHSCLREVPWATTTATDSGEYTPAEYDRDPDDNSLNDKLAALGYL